MNRLAVALTLVLTVFLSACAVPFSKGCLDVAAKADGEFKYTSQQAAVACSKAQFYAVPHLVMYDKENDKWSVNSNGILASDLEGVLSDQAKSLNTLLSYTSREDADWIDWFSGFRKGLEREEAVVLYLISRLNFVRTYNEFTDLVGELPKDLQPKEVEYFFSAGRKFYSMRILYPLRSLASISFTAEYLETAKREGRLKMVDSFEIADSQEYSKKVPDLYDANDFSWENRRRGWVINSYKITMNNEKPADNVVHYIEIYRKKKDLLGVEEKPAVRGFMAAGGTKVTVFVADYDYEGTLGYGSPEKIVKTFTDLTTGRDIFASSDLRTSLLEALYESEQNNPRIKPERKKPQDREIYVSIVKTGEAQIDVWEKGAWSIPFDYKILSQNFELQFDMPKTPEETRFVEREKLKKIKIFVREFKRDGKKMVIEYWLPKKEYSEWNITGNPFASTDIYTIRRKGNTEEKAEIEHFASKVMAMDYSYGGKWFRIVDEDGDGTFEKKREIGNPTVTEKPAESGRDRFPN